MKRLLPFCLLMVLIGSCSKPQGFEYRDLKNFKIDSWGFDRSNISMDLVYYNPNNFGVDLKKVDCDLYIDKNFVGKFSLDTLMHIPKKAEFSLPARMNVDMKNLMKNTVTVLLSNEVLVGAKGTTRVGKSGVFVNVPFNYEGRHKVDLF